MNHHLCCQINYALEIYQKLWWVKWIRDLGLTKSKRPRVKAHMCVILIKMLPYTCIVMQHSYVASCSGILFFHKNLCLPPEFKDGEKNLLPTKIHYGDAWSLMVDIMTLHC